MYFIWESYLLWMEAHWSLLANLRSIMLILQIYLDQRDQTKRIKKSVSQKLLIFELRLHHKNFIYFIGWTWSIYIFKRLRGYIQWIVETAQHRFLGWCCYAVVFLEQQICHFRLVCGRPMTTSEDFCQQRRSAVLSLLSKSVMYLDYWSKQESGSHYFCFNFS